MAEPYFVQKILVIWLQQSTKFSAKVVNLEIIIDMPSWCWTWPPNGSKHMRAEQKLLRKHKGSCKSSWSQKRKPKVFYTDISVDFGKACEDLSWNHCTSTPHRSETNGIAERAVRRLKEGTSAVLLQSGLDEKWRADSMECYTYLRNVTDLLSDGENALWKTFWETTKRTDCSVWFIGWVSSYCRKRLIRKPSISKEECLTWIVVGYALYAGWTWKGDALVADLEELATMDASEIYSKKKTQYERGGISQRKRIIYFSSRRWTN